MTVNNEEFIDFLIQAKLNTYASQGDEASVSPLLNGSKQLEYRLGEYVYRDIYFGFNYFIGQEVVEYKSKPIWSMVYSGGITERELTREEQIEVYSFLRKALSKVNKESIYRGPEIYETSNFRYINEIVGKIDGFSGVEIIKKNTYTIYELRYSGGYVT